MCLPKRRISSTCKFEKAKALVELRRYEEAIDSFNLAIKYKYEYKYPYVYYQIGYCLERLNRLEEALRYYNHALNMGCEDHDIYFAQSDVLKKLGR
jgi:tetratricopeptide (TPR) repeat protein